MRLNQQCIAALIILSCINWRPNQLAPREKKRKLSISQNKQMLSQHQVASAAQTHTSATINPAVMSCPANGPDSHGERGGPHVHASATHRRNFTPGTEDLFRNSTHSHRRNQHLNLGNFSLKKSRLREGRDFFEWTQNFLGRVCIVARLEDCHWCLQCLFHGRLPASALAAAQRPGTVYSKAAVVLLYRPRDEGI